MYRPPEDELHYNRYFCSFLILHKGTMCVKNSNKKKKQEILYDIQNWSHTSKKEKAGGKAKKSLKKNVCRRAHICQQKKKKKKRERGAGSVPPDPEYLKPGTKAGHTHEREGGSVLFCFVFCLFFCCSGRAFCCHVCIPFFIDFVYIF